MKDLVREINEGIDSINPISKAILQYGTFTGALIHISAVIIFLLSNTFGNYFKMMQVCDILLTLFEIVIGVVIVSILVEIFLRAKNSR